MAVEALERRAIWVQGSENEISGFIQVLAADFEIKDKVHDCLFAYQIIRAG